MALKRICELCGSTEKLVVHHIKPLSKGGLDTPENRVLLCKQCHDNRHRGKFGSGSQGLYSFEVNKTPVATFYIAGFEVMWQNFREICNREGTTASKKIKEFIERYVLVHDEGNPQMLLERYFEELKSKNKCFQCEGHYPELFKVKYISGLIAPTCKACLDKEQAKGSFSTVRKVMGVIR